MWFNKLSVYKKILIFMSLMILLLGAVLNTIIWNFMDDMISQQLQKRSMEIASHLVERSANYVLVDDYYSLHELVQQTQANSEDIRYILIVGTNGRLLAHTFAGVIPKSLSPSKEVSHTGTVRLTSDEGTIYDTVILNDNGENGFVRVGITEKYMKNLMLQKIHYLMIVTLLVCGLAAVLCLKFTSMVTRPISNLAAVADDIAQGNLKVRAAIDDGGEVGKLALAFNKMATGLIATTQDKEQLLGELEDKEKLRNVLIQKLITAQEDERKRLSRELHDETSQALTSLMVTMRILAEEATDDDQRKALMTSRNITAGILRDIRDLAVELRPPVLDDLGLAPAIEKYVMKFQERYGIVVNFHLEMLEQNKNSQVLVALYRIMQEGLTNVAKHSEAKHVKLTIVEQDNELLLILEDDGKGILDRDVEIAQKENRLGIYGMKERAEILGGSLTIHALPGKGTILQALIPK